MIAKNIKGKSFGGCVRYVMNDGCELLEAEGVFAENTQTIIRSFAMQRANRSEIKQPAGHIPMSFAPEDKGRMTNDFMVQLAKEYMQEMGIGNTQYIVVRHHNTDNDHIHIVYNRIDNDLKLISVNHDYDRNVKVCKKLKNRHGLTYGKDKMRVKREKLRVPDKVKYEIYDAIKAVLPTCIGYASLAVRLEDQGITTRYKYRSGTEIIEGISFEKGGITFKGSEIDRKFSHANLVKAFEDNAEREIMGLSERPKSETKPEKKSIENPVKPDLPTQPKLIPRPTVQPQEQSKPQSPQPEPVKRNPAIGGIELNDEQWEKLQSDGYIFLENMEKKDGGGKFSSYVFTNDEKKKAFFSNENPDQFVKYGKWEMRLRDKILIEKGCITRAKIKYWGGGFAHPYLWKPGLVDEKATEIKVIDSLISDSDYRGSWEDPRVPKEQRQRETEEFEKRLRQIGKNKEQNKGPKIG